MAFLVMPLVGSGLRAGCAVSHRMERRPVHARLRMSAMGSDQSGTDDGMLNVVQGPQPGFMNLLTEGSDDDLGEPRLVEESGVINEVQVTAFLGDLCDLTGLNCEEDGSPPRGADQALTPVESFARTKEIDGEVTIVDYAQEESSAIRDDSVLC